MFSIYYINLSGPHSKPVKILLISLPLLDKETWAEMVSKLLKLLARKWSHFGFRTWGLNDRKTDGKTQSLNWSQKFRVQRYGQELLMR